MAKNAFNRYRNFVTTTLRNAKRIYYEDKFTEFKKKHIG